MLRQENDPGGRERSLRRFRTTSRGKPIAVQAITTVLLAVMIIMVRPDGVPPKVAKAVSPTFPHSLPPGEVKAQEEIEASPEQVWGVLTDFPSYPIWNPFIYPVTGVPRPGNMLEVTMHPGAQSMTYLAAVVEAQPHRVLSWSGQIFSSGVFGTIYSFSIEPIQPGRVRLISREIRKGLAPVVEWLLGTDVQSGLSAMTKSARNRAELLQMSSRLSLWGLTVHR